MTAQIIRWTKPAARAWLIIEDARGRWHGELVRRGPGVERRTESGTLYLVRETVRSLGDGLPIVERPYSVGAA